MELFDLLDDYLIDQDDGLRKLLTWFYNLVIQNISEHLCIDSHNYINRLSLQLLEIQPSRNVPRHWEAG